MSARAWNRRRARQRVRTWERRTGFRLDGGSVLMQSFMVRLIGPNPARLLGAVWLDEMQPDGVCAVRVASAVRGASR